jgi:uncharacterized protein
MPYIVDGHNLIGAQGASALSDPEDEAQMADRLRHFCATSGKAVTVYFDRRSPGSSDPPPSGRLRLHFVSETSSADQAILKHLAHLGGDARNWTLVTSDQGLLQAAARTGVKTLSSTAFLRQMSGGRPAGSAEEEEPRQLSESDNEALLQAFQARRRSSDNKAQ